MMNRTFYKQPPAGHELWPQHKPKESAPLQPYDKRLKEETAVQTWWKDLKS